MTGNDAMEYIKEADARAKEKTQEAQQMDIVKKEAVKAAEAANIKPKTRPKARPKRPILGRQK